MSPEHVYKIAQHVARRYDIPGHEPDDLVQEAALAILDAMPNRPNARRGWWVLVARRRLNKLCRKACRQKADHLGDADPIDRRAERLLAEVESRQDLDVLLALLPERERLVLDFTRQSLGDEEIAARLGVSVGNLQVLRCRAVKKLKDLVSDGTERGY